MYYIDQRIRVICGQLDRLRFTDSRRLKEWQYKRGQYFRPDEADRCGPPWEPFDSGTMRWYSVYAGTDQFEGKFRGHGGDFRGITGEHYWFRTKAAIPQEFDGKSVWLRIKTQIEERDDGKNPQFLVFLNGEVYQGADMNHREILLSRCADGGTVLDVDVQAYTGTLHREFCFLAELYVLDEKISRLYWDLLVPLQAFDRLGADSRTRMDIQNVLNDTINLLDLRQPYSEAFYASVAAAQEHITRELYEKMGGHDEVTAACIGHTHIDVAWWWTVAQTREKVARSFATVLRLMEEYPDYKFMSSQPVLYYFLKQRYPELYEKIRQRAAEGRWETEGATWLEMDTNLTGGESLVRQFLYGKRFFREEFGYDCRVLWLPDVFGYSGSLPQIMKKSGVDYFMTTKLAWNQINKIPSDTFIWRGIDGSEVLTHLITTVGVGQDPKESFFTTYNGFLHPDAVMGAWERYQNKEINNDILISYGYGDGGGGPTRGMLETSLRMEKGLPGMPRVRQETVRAYFEELDARVRTNRRLERWEGELYFEYHRGTYTSMARNKRGNRRSELAMMDLELLGVMSGDYPAEADTRLWRDVILLNQFHDILPGSSIGEVYEVTKGEYDALLSETGSLIRERMDRLAGPGNGVTLFNTLGFARDDVVCLGDVNAPALQDPDGTLYPVQQTADGAVAWIRGLPSKGYMTLMPADVPEAPDGKPYGDCMIPLPEAADGSSGLPSRDCANRLPAASPFLLRDISHLETPFYRVELDVHGHIASLFDKEYERELAKTGMPLNQLRLFEDKPIHYDNWDIDRFYTEKSWPVDELLSMRWTEYGPVRATLELEYRCSLSVIRQKIRFYADSRRIDFETWADWKEHQHLLKAEFPLDIHTDEATFEMQFGSVTRKVHANTSWDKARFESCAHKWMDYSEGHYGVSLLNDCKYGHSVLDGVVSLTLIKCGVEPNPNADVEQHSFTYALYPHGGTWREAHTVQEAYKLNLPVRAAGHGAPGTRYSYAAVSPDHVILETVKQAEDGGGVILRLYESENARAKTVLTVPKTFTRAFSVNLLEEIEDELSILDGKICFTIMPFEIKTILIR